MLHPMHSACLKNKFHKNKTKHIDRRHLSLLHIFVAVDHAKNEINKNE